MSFTGRISINEDLILQVSATGNDTTGGLTNPFRQPQAAIDWAIVNLDFRNVDKLVISVGTGDYSDTSILILPNGVKAVYIQGQGVANTNIGSVYAHNLQTPIYMSNLTVRNATTSARNIMVDNATIWLDGSIRLTGGGVHAMNATCAGMIRGVSDALQLEINGNYAVGIRAAYCGHVDFYANRITFTSANFTSATVEAYCQAYIWMQGVTWAGSATGVRFRCTYNSTIISPNSANIPGNVAGVTTNGGQVA